MIEFDLHLFSITQRRKGAKSFFKICFFGGGVECDGIFQFLIDIQSG
jgi:hypothetical protein